MPASRLRDDTQIKIIDYLPSVSYNQKSKKKNYSIRSSINEEEDKDISLEFCINRKDLRKP